LPVEAGGVDGRVVDERVAVDDVLRERGQGLAFGRGADPKGELGDLDRFGREVDAGEVLLEDEVRDLVLEFVGIGRVRLFEVADHLEVAMLQYVIGLEQERAGAASGVDDFQVLQDFEAAAPVRFVIGDDAALGIGRVDAAFGGQ